MDVDAMSRPGWPMLGAVLRAHRRVVLQVLVWSVLEALPSLASGAIIAVALDRGFLAGRPATGLAWLGLLGAAMLARAFATYQLFPQLGALVEPLRDVLTTVVVRAALGHAVAAAAPPDGASVSRLTSQVETVRSLTSALLRSVRQAGLALLLALLGLATLAPEVAAFTAVTVAATLAVFVTLVRRLGYRQREQLLAEERLATEAGANFEGLRDLAASGARGSAEISINRYIVESERAAGAVARLNAGSTLAVAVGGRLPVLAVLAAGPWLVRRGLSIGALIGATMYLVATVEPALRAAVGLIGTWGVQLGIVLRRLGETATTTPVAPHRTHRPAPGAELSLDSVTFAYGTRADPVIRDLTLRVPAGSRLAIVGPSGIGKSTLANLIAGIATPRAGEIYLGGVALGDIDRDQLCRHVALIPQEAYVFSASVRDNVGYLCPAVTDEHLRSAVAAVGAEALVARLGGLDAQLGIAGAELSAGERQLIALARTYASDAEVVVLDEATCHLDPIAERYAESAFAARSGTVIIIAHRMSSAMRADRVLIIDGDDTRVGTHHELLAASPLYTELVGYWQATTGTGDKFAKARLPFSRTVDTVAR